MSCCCIVSVSRHVDEECRVQLTKMFCVVKFLAGIQDAYDKNVRERNAVVGKESPVTKNRAQWRPSVGI